MPRGEQRTFWQFGLGQKIVTVEPVPAAKPSVGPLRFYLRNQMNAPNIFVTLSKYGSSEAENYLTEAFVFLLDLLLERTPEIGLAFVNKVCGLSGNRQLSTPEAITISTQIVVDEGRPDIQIKQGADTLIYV